MCSLLTERHLPIRIRQFFIIVCHMIACQIIIICHCLALGFRKNPIKNVLKKKKKTCDFIFPDAKKSITFPIR